MKFSIDAVIKGSLIRKPISEAKALLEEMASNN